jgi:hypothetical protein
MLSNQPSANQISALLQEAQAKLLERRRQLPPRTPSPRLDAAPDPTKKLLDQAQKELLKLRKLAGIATAKQTPQSPIDWKAQFVSVEPTTQPSPSKPRETVAVYPSLLLAMLKQNQEAAGRVYLLLRHLDSTGRGWLPIEEIRAQLTRKESPLKVMGWRRLRQLLHQGEGVFWERDSQGRIWLRSALRIALNLDCSRLKGNRINLPIATLLGGIGTVRAHFYASFHSGRRSDNPISRQTLESITGLSPRTQRDYDRLAQVKRQRNIAVGPRHTQISVEEQYWQRGGAVFTFIDSQGQQGPKNQQYLAWHLPNSYQAPHQKRSKGRQKKINQQLVSLVSIGVQGTDQQRVDKLFWPNGAAAGKAYNKDQELDSYWPRGKAQRRPGVLWYVLPGGEK